MLKRFSHVMIYATDLERAMKWYVDALGFNVNYASVPHYVSMHHPELQLRVDLHPDPKKENVGRGAMLYFAAEDLDKTVAELRSRGIHVSDPRSRGESPRFTEFADSEGNPIGLYEDKPAPSKPG